MKRLDDKYKDQVEELTEEEKEEAKGIKGIKWASLIIVAMALIAFIIIVYFTDLIGVKYGKTFENLALGVVALGLIIAWYFNNKKR